MLTGDLSPVQAAALDILMVLEAKDRAQRDEEALKQAILGHDPVRFLPLLYPQIAQAAPEREVEEVDEISQQEVMDTEGGEWLMPEMDPQDAEAILADLLAAGGGSMGMQDVERFEQ